MQVEEIKIGDIVEARYNSGTYVGEVLEDKRNFYLVKVLAVLEHPTQGDLHHIGQVNGVAFHERKALAFGEKMNAKKRFTKKYEGKIPDYVQSLKRAVENKKKELQQEDTPFNKLSLEKIKDLEEHYYNKIFEE